MRERLPPHALVATGQEGGGGCSAQALAGGDGPAPGGDSGPATGGGGGRSQGHDGNGCRRRRCRRAARRGTCGRSRAGGGGGWAGGTRRDDCGGRGRRRWLSPPWHGRRGGRVPRDGRQRRRSPLPPPCSLATAAIVVSHPPMNRKPNTSLQDPRAGRGALYFVGIDKLFHLLSVSLRLPWRQYSVRASPLRRATDRCRDPRVGYRCGDLAGTLCTMCSTTALAWSSWVARGPRCRASSGTAASRSTPTTHERPRRGRLTPLQLGGPAGLG